MEISYKRSMNDNYMVIGGGEIRKRDSYQTRMLLENQIQSLLPCKLQKVNGEELFYYGITGCQSLKNLFENRKFDRIELENLFISVLKIMENLDEYLLNRDYLLLQPSCIFRGKENKEYYFVWCPVSEADIEQEFRQLTEYILPKIDHTDKEAVTLGYGIYKESTEPGMRMDILKEQVYVQKEESVSHEWESGIQDEEEREQERQKILDDFYRDEDREEKQSAGKIGILVSTIIGAGIFWAVRNLRVMDSIYLWAVVIGSVLVLGGVIGGIYFWKYQHSKKEKAFDEKIEVKDDIQEKNFQTENFIKESEGETGSTALLQEKETSFAYLEELDQANPERYFLEKEITIIGKWKENVDIWLNIPTVSRLHAKIIRKGQKDVLVDINSRNGTILNNLWLNPEQEYDLQSDDIIIFAQKKFRYVYHNAQMSHALACNKSRKDL